MSFGDILSEWESVKRQERDRRAVPTASSPPSYEDDLRAYLNRHGIVDKDADDEEDGRSPRERAEALRRMRPQASLDLHGLTREEALRRLALFLEQALRGGLAKVLIIHGKGAHSKGEAVLERAVASFLEGHPAAGMRGHPGREQGGRGATWVALRQKDRNALPGQG
jgi:DNA-nicking Smr family endonuclease